MTVPAPIEPKQSILTSLRPELEDLARAADGAGYESAQIGYIDQAARLYGWAAQLREEAVSAPAEGGYRLVADRERHLRFVDAARLEIARAYAACATSRIGGGIVAIQ